MDFNAGPIFVFVATMLVYVTTSPLAYVASGSVMALSRHWLCLCSFWPLKLHCRNKVAKCRDINAVVIFPFFVVSLSQQYRLAFFLSHFCDKLFKCRDKVSIYVSSLFSIIVITMKEIS